MFVSEAEPEFEATDQNLNCQLQIKTWIWSCRLKLDGQFGIIDGSSILVQRHSALSCASGRGETLPVSFVYCILKNQKNVKQLWQINGATKLWPGIMIAAFFERWEDRMKYERRSKRADLIRYCRYMEEPHSAKERSNFIYPALIETKVVPCPSIYFR